MTEELDSVTDAKEHKKEVFLSLLEGIQIKKNLPYLWLGAQALEKLKL